MNSPYLSCLKTYWAEIWNVSWLPPNILLGPILVLLRPSLIIFFQYVSMCNVIFNSWAGPQSRSCHLYLYSLKFISQGLRSWFHFSATVLLCQFLLNKLFILFQKYIYIINNTYGIWKHSLNWFIPLFGPCFRG